MNKVAVFGKPGGGKSTFSKKLASATGLQLHQLDSIEYKQNGNKVSAEEFISAHDEVLSSNGWIVDGLGRIESFYQRLEAADTLIYIDLPYRVNYWWVTKRFFKSLFVKPEGWPEGSSVLKGTIQSYKILKICPTFWNDAFLQKLKNTSKNKSLYIISSVSQLNCFIDEYVI